MKPLVFLQHRISAHKHSRIWDTATGQCLQTLVHEDNAPVVSVRFSPNGKYVLAWTLDGSIRLWDYVEGLCKKTYQGHENKKYSIGGAFGVYGQEAFVVSGSEDGNIVLWDVKSKNILQRLEGHDGVTLWVETHPCLDLIASGGLDAKVKIWINEDDVKEEAAADEGPTFDVLKQRTLSPDLKQEAEE